MLKLKKALKAASTKKCLLAVANGVKMENVQEYLPFCDILVVGTCISSDFHNLDPRRMDKLKRKVDRYFEKQYE